MTKDEAYLENQLRVLDKLVRNARCGTRYASRSEVTCLVMQEALDAMQRVQVPLGIPRRDIAVFRYLTNNPGAYIVADRNVLAAFDSAERALKEEFRRRH